MIEITAFKVALWAMSVIFYIVSAICLYKIGKRREIRGRWMAWIPYAGFYWMLGSISDHYDRWRKGKDHRLRVWMLVSTLFMVVYEVILLYYSYWMTKYALDVPTAGLAWWLVVLIVIVFAMIGVCVLFGFALHRMYYSCNPKRAALMTVMSIVFSFFSIGPIICLICCCGKDDGFVLAEIVDPEAEKKRLEMYN